MDGPVDGVPRCGSVCSHELGLNGRIASLVQDTSRQCSKKKKEFCASLHGRVVSRHDKWWYEVPLQLVGKHVRREHVTKGKHSMIPFICGCYDKVVRGTVWHSLSRASIVWGKKTVLGRLQVPECRITNWPRMAHKDSLKYGTYSSVFLFRPQGYNDRF